MKIVLQWNARPTQERVLADSKRVRELLAIEFLKHANYYVRMDTGELEASSHRFSRPSEGELIWETPYARRVYYTGTPSRDVNPNARLQWAKVAYDTHRDALQRMADTLAQSGGKL